MCRRGPYLSVPDPTLINTAPQPDFYFLALYPTFRTIPRKFA